MGRSRARRFCIAIAALAACYRPHPQAGAPCGVGGTCPSGLVCTPHDTCEVASAVDAGPICFGHGLISICPARMPTTGATITTTVAFDTDATNACTEVIGGLCVVEHTDVTIAGAGTVRATGSRPLVVLATGDMTIAGTIDVASHRATATIGAGADVGCASGVLPATFGGGAGGSFVGTGGRGGRGTNMVASAGGVAAPALAATTIRGGCAGQVGDGGGGGAPAGNGGGAVYLIATSLTITGTIDASGASGSGGRAMSSMLGVTGAGGGGAGGFIGLDAESLVVSASGQLFANGAGGGEGGNTMVDGMAGGEPMAPTPAAAGGRSNNPGGGGGGSGSSGMALDGATASSAPSSGGGGGGGAGAIRIFAPARTVVGALSPPAT